MKTRFLPDSGSEGRSRPQDTRSSYPRRQKIKPSRLHNTFRKKLKEHASSHAERLVALALKLGVEPWVSEIYTANLDQERDLVRPPEAIFLLEKAIAVAWEPRLKLHWAPEVLSFQAGKSSLDGVRDLADLVKRDPGPWYVLRRDISSYTDSIPLVASSPLWVQLRATGLDPREIALLQQLLRAELKWRGEESGAFCRVGGISTGSALTPMISNLYLGPVDRALLEIPGSFYRRYGDDIVFAHRDRSSAFRAREEFERALLPLRLRSKIEKSSDIIWTRRGGHVEEGGFRESDHIDLLGWRVTHRGIRLPPGKFKTMLQRYRYRMNNVLELHRGSCDEDRAHALIQATHAQFARDSVGIEPHFRMMLQLGNDPGQWRELDTEIFRTLSTLLARKPLPLAYRIFSPRRLVREFKLRTPGHLRQIYV